MNTTNTTTTTKTATATMGKITMIKWNQICEAGVYVDTTYPRYYRVTDKCLTATGAPLIQCNDFTVAKISSNPTIPVTEIQTICTTNKLPVAK